MPYSIKTVPGGFVVITDGTSRVHSRRPLSRNLAERQLTALNMHGGGISGGKISNEEIARMTGRTIRKRPTPEQAAEAKRLMDRRRQLDTADKKAEDFGQQGVIAMNKGLAEWRVAEQKRRNDEWAQKAGPIISKIPFGKINNALASAGDWVAKNEAITSKIGIPTFINKGLALSKQLREGGGVEPSEEATVQAAQQAYGNTHTALPGGYEPVHGATGQVKAWKHPDSPDLLIGIRGTELNNKSDAVRDLVTNANLAFGNLKNTNRYKEDEAAVKALLAAHPGSKAHLASHSLGSAIARELENVVPVATSRGYNPAFQPSAFFNPGKQQRKYYGSDFLGQIGRYIPGAQHVPSKPKTWTEKIVSYASPGLSKFYSGLKHHSMRGFFGGRKLYKKKTWRF